MSTYPPYPEYRDSGVDWLGEVPAEWDITKLKRVVDFTTGWTPPTGESRFFSGENLWANISDLKAPQISDTEKQISDEAASDTRMPIVRAGSLLFSFKLSIGQVAFASTDMYTNEAIAAFSPDQGVDLGFAYYAFPLMIPRNAETNIYGAKLLSRDRIRNAAILLPPAKVQKSVADFLDRITADIDRLISEQQRLIGLLQEKRQAVISHAVTKGLNPDAPMKLSGVEWLGEVPAHWDVTRVGWTLTKISYGFTNPMPTEDEGPYLLTANDIAMGFVRYDSARRTSGEAFSNLLTEKSRPKKGDILLTKDGTLGRVAIHDGSDACINQSVALLRPEVETASSEFLARLLMGGIYQARMIYEAGGTTIKHIYISRLAKMPIALPPQSEQEQIVSFLRESTARFDHAIDRCEASIDLLEQRRSALISAAVTGKIDVRDFSAGKAVA